MREEIRSIIGESRDIKNAILNDDELLSSIEQITIACISAISGGNKIILAGNGGSAADAQHIAAEFVSRYSFDRPGIASIALTVDTSILTAVSNDYSFEHVFRRQIEANGRAGDVFFGLSTSGKSGNILLAIDECITRGITTVGFTGLNGKVMKEKCDYCVMVPSSSTPRIQESHIMIGHAICSLVENGLFG